MAEVGIEPPTSRSGVQGSTTRPPRSPPSFVAVQPGLWVGKTEDRLSHDAVHIKDDDPGLTLTYFMARSNWVAYKFEWGKFYKLI